MSSRGKFLIPVSDLQSKKVWANFGSGQLFIWLLAWGRSNHTYRRLHLEICCLGILILVGLIPAVKEPAIQGHLSYRY